MNYITNINKDFVRRHRYLMTSFWKLTQVLSNSNSIDSIKPSYVIRKTHHTFNCCNSMSIAIQFGIQK